MMEMQRNFCSITPKTTFYAVDGSGRDSYIAVNNGGMTAAKSSPFGIDCGTPSSPRKF